MGGNYPEPRASHITSGFGVHSELGAQPDQAIAPLFLAPLVYSIYGSVSRGWVGLCA